MSQKWFVPHNWIDNFGIFSMFLRQVDTLQNSANYVNIPGKHNQMIVNIIDRHMK